MDGNVDLILLVLLRQYVLIHSTNISASSVCKTDGRLKTPCEAQKSSQGLGTTNTNSLVHYPRFNPASLHYRDCFVNHREEGSYNTQNPDPPEDSGIQRYAIFSWHDLCVSNSMQLIESISCLTGIQHCEITTAAAAPAPAPAAVTFAGTYYVLTLVSRVSFIAFHLSLIQILVVETIMF